METVARGTLIVFLCDYYNQASKDRLLIQVAGYDATTGHQSDGFLPQDALSPFTYYVGLKAANHAFSTKFLCRPFWVSEIGWRVCLILPKNVPRITYPEGSKARIVKSVRWLEQVRKIRQIGPL